jgi:hypothetical protein
MKMNKLTIALALALALATGSAAIAKPYHTTEAGMSGQWYASDADLRAARAPNPADF